jgi:polyisoprenoid-binding protein YceI
VPRALALALLTGALAPSTGRAAAEPYGIRLPADGLVVDVPYSLGTHHEHVTEVQGVVRIDPEALRLERGRLVIPLAAFRSDDPQRGCHLREALGLDYARSRYPREHVCDGQNRLPTSGPDAIAYPEILVELSRGAPAGKASGAGQVEVEGALTVHGVSRPVRLALTVARDPSGLLRVRGRVPLRLDEFGIKVKSAHVLFVDISVRNEITLAVDVLLEPVRGALRGER